jgi:ribonuclease P protein subunit POP4
LRKKQYYLRHQKPKPLSAKEKREMGIYKLRKEEIRYELYRGLHNLWNGYMLEILGFTDRNGDLVSGWESKKVANESAGPLLVSADFHGAEVEVVRCKDGGRVGCKGIVVRDSKYTFVVVTEKDEVRSVPKKGTVFRYAVEVRLEGECERKMVFEVYGRQFEYRPVERANRKFKWKNREEYV